MLIKLNQLLLKSLKTALYACSLLFMSQLAEVDNTAAHSAPAGSSLNR